MIIAVSSRGNTADSLVDERFGRCAYFALYNTENQKLTFIDNTAKDSASGAGPAAVALIASAKASKIISGEFGFKIKDMLVELGIEMVVENSGKTIAEVLNLN